MSFNVSHILVGAMAGLARHLLGEKRRQLPPMPSSSAVTVDLSQNMHLFWGNKQQGHLYETNLQCQLLTLKTTDLSTNS